MRRPIRIAFQWVEGRLDHLFGRSWNPFYALGALGFFFYWVVAVSGLYLYAFFDTGIPAAYESVEALTHSQWWLGGVMRSLHRYASDGLVLVILIHIVREFAFDRYRGARWYSWVLGVPTLWLMFAAGITGYWLVWDKLAQYVAEATTEWLDALPIFGLPVARNFLAPSYLDSRFFTLMLFIHIALPLLMLFIMWFHVNRVSYPKINPARGLAVGTFLMLLVLSFVYPATSQGIADLAEVPSPVRLDWYYLWIYPLIDLSGERAIWVLSFAATLVLMLMPWLPPKREKAIAKVDLDNCNGCTRCAVDCPFGAIVMGPRTDGKPFDKQAVVNPSLCVACGICTGSCPTATPFRRASALVPGIDLGWLPLAEVRERSHRAAERLTGSGRVLIFGCDHGLAVDQRASPDTGAVSLPCIGMLPPSMIDYVLSRRLADGVVLTGCREGQCNYRLGRRWTEERVGGLRDPQLRARVPRERIAEIWAAPVDRRRFERELQDFQERLRALAARSADARPEQRVAGQVTE
jgi:quinol-cytochrome oxidoreductase complex cytochrome b subunit/coenzyme F420-reducing hydrogenase delta subunit